MEGNIGYVKEYLSSDSFKQSNGIISPNMVTTACNFGHLEIIKIIFNSTLAKTNINRSNSNMQLIQTASLKGDLSIVEYLSSDPKIFRDEYFALSAANNAAAFGHLEVFKYILDKFNQDSLLTKDLNEGIVFDSACTNGRLNILEYMVSNKIINKNNDIHINKDLYFKSAFWYLNFDVMQYFIFELDIEKTPDIEACLRDAEEVKSANRINNWFQRRELNKTLNTELDLPKPTLALKKIKV